MPNTEIASKMQRRPNNPFAQRSRGGGGSRRVSYSSDPRYGPQVTQRHHHHRSICNVIAIVIILGVSAYAVYSMTSSSSPASPPALIQDKQKSDSTTENRKINSKGSSDQNDFQDISSLRAHDGLGEEKLPYVPAEDFVESETQSEQYQQTRINENDKDSHDLADGSDQRLEVQETTNAEGDGGLDKGPDRNREDAAGGGPDEPDSNDVGNGSENSNDTSNGPEHNIHDAEQDEATETQDLRRGLDPKKIHLIPAVSTDGQDPEMKQIPDEGDGDEVDSQDLGTKSFNDTVESGDGGTAPSDTTDYSEENDLEAEANNDHTTTGTNNQSLRADSSVRTIEDPETSGNTGLARTNKSSPLNVTLPFDDTYNNNSMDSSEWKSIVGVNSRKSNLINKLPAPDNIVTEAPNKTSKEDTVLNLPVVLNDTDLLNITGRGESFSTSVKVALQLESSDLGKVAVVNVTYNVTGSVESSKNPELPRNEGVNVMGNSNEISDRNGTEINSSNNTEKLTVHSNDTKSTDDPQQTIRQNKNKATVLNRESSFQLKIYNNSQEVDASSATDLQIRREVGNGTAINVSDVTRVRNTTTNASHEYSVKPTPTSVIKKRKQRSSNTANITKPGANKHENVTVGKYEKKKLKKKRFWERQPAQNSSSAAKSAQNGKVLPESGNDENNQSHIVFDTRATNETALLGNITQQLLNQKRYTNNSLSRNSSKVNGFTTAKSKLKKIKIPFMSSGWQGQSAKALKANATARTSADLFLKLGSNSTQQSKVSDSRQNTTNNKKKERDKKVKIKSKLLPNNNVKTSTHWKVQESDISEGKKLILGAKNGQHLRAVTSHHGSNVVLD